MTQSLHIIHGKLAGLLLLPVALLVALPLAAQEQSSSAEERPTEAEQQNQDSPARPRDRVQFIDVPVPVTPGQDSPLPPANPHYSQALQEAEISQRTAAVENYTDTIADIESRGGAWDQALVEQLAALGRVQHELGEHAVAADTLSRALHVSRINAGLHALDQVPVVEALIDSYAAIGNWEQVDIYQNYLYYVQRRAYGMNDPRIIPVLEELGNWNVEAFTIGVGEPLGLRLSTAQLVFNAAKRLVDTHFGTDDERYVAYLRHIASSAYLVARNPEYIAEAGRPQYRAEQERLRDMLQEPRTASPRGFLSGEEALQDIVSHYEEMGDSSYLLAEAITDLADWQLLFNRRTTARNLYARAWQIVAEQEDGPELLSRLFGQVIAIPSFSELPTNLQLGTGDGQNRGQLAVDYIDVGLDVTSYGEPRNLELLSEETEANAEQYSQLRRAIRDMRFRPLIVDGGPVDSEGHVLRYRFWY